MTLTISEINPDINYFINDEKISLEEYDAYPFTNGIGINSILSKYFENNILFPVYKFNKDKKRKEKFDNIRKKIKSSFHKILKDVINSILKNAGSINYSFESFPQCFISDIRLKINHEVFQLPYKDLFEYTYQMSLNINYKKEKNGKNSEEIQKINNRIEKEKKIAKKKYEKNLKTLEFLNDEKNEEISKLANWKRIGNMKYEQLLEKFFNSLEFELSIKKLEEKKNKNYVYDYILLAKNYIDDFKNYKNSETQENISKLFQISNKDDDIIVTNCCNKIKKCEYKNDIKNNDANKENDVNNLNSFFDENELFNPDIFYIDDSFNILDFNNNTNYYQGKAISVQESDVIIEKLNKMDINYDKNNSEDENILNFNNIKERSESNNFENSIID